MRRELGDGFELDDDPARIDVGAVHAYISGESYWGRGRPRELVRRAIEGSLRVVGLYRGAEQVGFARAVSDGATVAYLADVYVLPAHRGRGLGLALVGEILDGAAQWEARWLLHTADAQALYAKFGFVESPASAPVYPLMERTRVRAPAKIAGERPGAVVSAPAEGERPGAAASAPAEGERPTQTRGSRPQ